MTIYFTYGGSLYCGQKTVNEENRARIDKNADGDAAEAIDYIMTGCRLGVPLGPEFIGESRLGFGLPFSFEVESVKDRENWDEDLNGYSADYYIPSFDDPANNEDETSAKYRDLTVQFSPSLLLKTFTSGNGATHRLGAGPTVEAKIGSGNVPAANAPNDQIPGTQLLNGSIGYGFQLGWRVESVGKPMWMVGLEAGKTTAKVESDYFSANRLPFTQVSLGFTISGRKEIAEKNKTDDLADVDLPDEEIEEVLDTDGDGILDKVDECKELKEDFDNVDDADGCPEFEENNDRDNDGISNERETKLYKTDPDNFDTDGDGAGDGAEIVMTLKNAHVDYDTDKDGLINPLDFNDDETGILVASSHEREAASRLTDSIDSTMSKIWHSILEGAEIDFEYLDADHDDDTIEDTLDSDNDDDSIIDSLEPDDFYPANGVPDYNEVTSSEEVSWRVTYINEKDVPVGPYDTRPVVANGEDADGDSLSNADEKKHATDPWDPDTDKDGIWDGDEMVKNQAAHPENPLDPDRDAFINPLDRNSDSDDKMDGNDGTIAHSAGQAGRKDPQDQDATGVLDFIEPIDLSALARCDDLTLSNSILFSVGSYVLKPEAIGTIGHIGRYLQDHEELEIEIQGHASVEGLAGDNLNLSQNRANAVEKALIAVGVDDRQLETKAYGENEPLDASGNPTTTQVDVNGEVTPVDLSEAALVASRRVVLTCATDE